MPLSEEELEKLESKPEKMAIGMEGGFQVDKEKFKIEKSYALVFFPDEQTFPLPNPDLPLQLQLAITKIQVPSRHQTAEKSDPF